MSNPGPVAEPNVTPLIDVMLVLLILFMLVTPVAHHDLDTALPRPPDPDDRRTPPTTPLIAVRLDSIDLNGRRLATIADMEGQLRDLYTGRADRTVFVRVDGEVAYGRAVAAMDAARAAGAERIGLLSSSAAPPADGSAFP
jgi:biopolymer transport protein TolR